MDPFCQRQKKTEEASFVSSLGLSGFVPPESLLLAQRTWMAEESDAPPTEAEFAESLLRDALRLWIKAESGRGDRSFRRKITVQQDEGDAVVMAVYNDPDAERALKRIIRGDAYELPPKST